MAGLLQADKVPKSLPLEKDVPHWAASVVRDMRVKYNLPTAVTDRMIYARLESFGSWAGESTIALGIMSLAEEVSWPTDALLLQIQVELESRGMNTEIALYRSEMGEWRASACALSKRQLSFGLAEGRFYSEGRPTQQIALLEILGLVVRHGDDQGV